MVQFDNPHGTLPNDLNTDMTYKLALGSAQLSTRAKRIQRILLALFSRCDMELQLADLGYVTILKLLSGCGVEML
jgi:hypothetical protein